MSDKLPVCPHCGSKNVRAVEGFYRCNDCNLDFGREMLSDDGRPLIEAVKGLRYRDGDIVSGSVRLRIVQDENECLYEVYSAYEGGVNKIADVLSMKEWETIKKKLFEKLYVADWQREYIPVNDGQTIFENHEWELDLDISDDEQIAIRGYDCQPVYWNDLMKVLKPFLNKLAEE